LSNKELLAETQRFFLGRVASELTREIDWRAKGYGKSVIPRAAIYVAAMVRDIVRIPLHHQDGIGQARFRPRIDYISESAIPILKFFQVNYPIDDRQCLLIDEALELLEKGVRLISDGRIPALDEWYATMEEFHDLTEYSRQAATRIEEMVIGSTKGQS